MTSTARKDTTPEATVAVVTGAGSGIGAATALRLATDGATVVLTGRTADKLESIVAGAGDIAGNMVVRVVDSSDESAVAELFASVVAEFGRLDTLVNNAAVATPGAVTETDTADWAQVMRVDVDGVFFGCRAAVPHLVETGGSIVNVASVSGMGGDWNNVAYNAAKGAVVNMTRAMAMDHAADGVRVNAVSPSLTMTDMTAGMTDDEDLMARFADRIPMGRAGQPEEVADVIAFLTGPDARFVTGVNLPVDGGLSASNGQPRM
ncbi:SDR family NAD(P)-dependent oxidoreductase [Pseudonocardia sp. KRD291]|uniref:SDR family NAD(P)-dependent oxidoreductase n=1 Tax=Pseudonocardia sp. KRD291 TaxID=2792007 RepID=UPI001C4A15F6|nr:SDR family oxidoreductase [Pseudonocardia sp. KRD291]MBW0103584.1 SDR family oxidoreductase [Pseudonocardia sp. KRD291]